MPSIRLIAQADPVIPKVSVIIPAYNSARTIGRCVTALGDQETRHSYEIIVVHSGSDNTCELAQASVGACRTLQLERRMAPAAARHRGVLEARGEILAFVDSDIFVTSRWLDRVVVAATRRSDLTCGSIANGNPSFAISRAEQLLMFSEFLPESPRRPSWFALSGNMLLRRAAYERFGPFSEVRAAEDVVFSRRLISSGGSVEFDPELKVFHDNRTSFLPFVKNQWLLGRHTAAARRLVPFADTSSWLLFVLLLPISPAIKMARILARLVRWNRRGLPGVVKDAPALIFGACVYCCGMASDVLVPANQHRDFPRNRSRSSAA